MFVTTDSLVASKLHAKTQKSMATLEPAKSKLHELTLSMMADMAPKDFCQPSNLSKWEKIVADVEKVHDDFLKGPFDMYHRQLGLTK